MFVILWLLVQILLANKATVPDAIVIFVSVLATLEAVGSVAALAIKIYLYKKLK